MYFFCRWVPAMQTTHDALRIMRSLQSIMKQPVVATV
jgi:hypothetical protein